MTANAGSNGLSTATSPKIVYLDQNKWIDLARALKAPDEFPEHYVVLERLVAGAKAGELIVPVTQANIYETHKVFDRERRHDLAFTQATLSQGRVFRGRSKRVEVEATDVMRRAFGLEPLPRKPGWFLSTVFFEATIEWEIDGLGGKVEAGRIRDANEPLSMRRRIYSANLVVDDLDLINGLILKADLPTTDGREIFRKCARKLITECPSYYIERELTLKLESLSRDITENDFRDMQTFGAIVAYADIVVAENMFSNLARQSQLDKRFDTRIFTSLLDLNDCLELERAETASK